MIRHRTENSLSSLSAFYPDSPMSDITDTFIAPPCPEQIDILYQDEHLLLINKPAGCSVFREKIRKIWIPCITGWYSCFPAVPGAPAGFRYVRAAGGCPQ